MNFFKTFTNQCKNQLKIRKDDAGKDWVVKKGYSILYIGTKEKCKIFMDQGVKTE